MRTIARLVLIMLALGVASIGCRAQVRGTATVTAPELVLVEGDVWVVEQYQEPVFYTEGYYWRWYGSVWYRSSVHTGDWVQVTVVPASIQRIPNPQTYANYTAPAGATKRTGPPDHAPAHGVRGTQPGHAEGGPPGHDKGGPPAHAGGPAMKEEKGPPPGAGGPPMKEDKGPPPGAGGPSMKDDKGPAKDDKPAAAKSGGDDKKGGPDKGGPDKGGPDKSGPDKGGPDKGGPDKKGGKK